MNILAGTLSGIGGPTEAHFVDVAAAMYAVRPDIATTAERALVKVSTVNGLTGGQTFIGDNIGDKVFMIAQEP